MSNMTRRAALGGLAALPAISIPERLQSAATSQPADTPFAGPGYYRIRHWTSSAVRLPPSSYYSNRFLQVHLDASTRGIPSKAEFLLSRATFRMICIERIAAEVSP
jgi:hypothetical protein